MKKRILLTDIYNSVPTIPYEDGDEPIHTEANGYECDESTNPETNSCPCHDAWWQRQDQDRNATTQTATGSWW
jgi:hypothetical protein